jgi:hypothetical protein
VLAKAVGRIAAWYAVEDEIRGRPPDERNQVRQNTRADYPTPPDPDRLRHPLPQLFAVVLAGGLLDLAANLLYTAFDLGVLMKPSSVGISGF